MGAMNGLRKHFTMGLVLLMCTLTGHCSESAPSAAPTTAATGKDAQHDLRRMIEIVKHVEESRGRHTAKTEAPSTSRVKTSSVEPKDLRNLKTERDQAVVVFPRDLRKKEKFIKHITGPLYFSPKCRKQVYRVYHHTRECTIPAYFKRCARLLTRLAGSLQCTEG
ncbi:ALK and LTK ligand 2-like [Seriola lalandi dorsalis]|uniref:ALK and LTK ligand 2-like n=1 Tax=Seriola lalandi dorsalis TaxID=1841481 RepID=A0A3B4X3Q1_SERLL|nr:ALK and LTK ligand 2-like [Seriola lalandi dorsalis]XP_023256236.1 ALK and LTK ligand 2-like [Seriola lalandi dorsalis]